MGKPQATGKILTFIILISRLVNAVVEKTRKKREMSIAEAAEEYAIPRMLIDVRHGEYDVLLKLTPLVAV